MKRYAMMMAAAMLAMACGGGETTTTGRAPAQVVMLKTADRGNVVLVGSEKPFSGVRFAFSSPAASPTYRGTLEGWYNATPKVSNYFGTANIVGLTDNTNAFRQNGSVTWTTPSDWAPGYWVDSTDPSCDEMCRGLDRSLYWAAIEMPNELQYYELTPGGLQACEPASCDPNLPLSAAAVPAPSFTIASLELL